MYFRRTNSSAIYQLIMGVTVLKQTTKSQHNTLQSPGQDRTGQCSTVQYKVQVIRVLEASNPKIKNKQKKIKIEV